MAKIVIAGKADCPYFTKIELLGDCLAKNLPNFKLHKILKQPAEWDGYLKQLCTERGWSHSKSPIVWRELIDRGGKGTLIGGANDFLEYVDGYYGFHSELSSSDMMQISEENLETTILLDEEIKHYQQLSKPINVCISNASCDVCYQMICSIANGDVFGSSIEINLHLLDTEDKLEFLAATKMEAEDLACPLLRAVKVTSDPKEAFADCTAIVLLDELEPVADQTKEDYYKENAALFCGYARAIEEVANSDVKVLIAGLGPVNFNAYMMIKNSPYISRWNIVAMSRLVENQVKGILAKKIQLNSANIADVVIWGNPAGVYYADHSKARVHNSDGAIWGPPFYSRPVSSLIHDAKWFETEFLETLSKHSLTLSESLKRRPTISHAAAVTSMLTDWFNGSKEGQIYSLGIASEGWYDIPEGTVCSVPVTVSPKGNWCVVQDIAVSDVVKDKISDCVEDTLDEIDIMFPNPDRKPKKPPTPVTPAVGDVIAEETADEGKEDDASSENKTDLSADEAAAPSSGDDDTDPDRQPTLEKIEEEKNDPEDSPETAPGTPTDMPSAGNVVAEETRESSRPGTADKVEE